MQFIQRLQLPLPSDLPQSAALAYWINAYNALTLNHVLSFFKERLAQRGNLTAQDWTNWSVKTAVINAPNYTFFKQKVHQLNGGVYSLDDLEHTWIRPGQKGHFDTPLIHAALNCASQSCPPLWSSVFHPQRVHQQLENIFRRFVRDPLRNPLSKYKYSKIFKWFEDDFKSLGGVQAVLIKYALPSQVKQIKGHFDSFSFTEYDWTLNVDPRASFGILNHR